MNSWTSQLHAGRYFLGKHFTSFVKSELKEVGPLKVAVVGGSIDEPEVRYLEELGYRCEVATFGVENDSILLDLNLPFNNLNVVGTFDLVICAQVLEHIWNLNEAINSLTRLMKIGGLLWVNCPTSNHAHGSPEYFSAGYSSKMLRNHLIRADVEILMEGELGTERLYKMTHSQLFWPSHTEHKNPFLRGIHRSRRLFPLRFVRNLVKNLQAAGWSGRELQGSIFSTETYLGCRRTTSRA